MSTLEDTIYQGLNMNAKSVSLDGVPEWGGPSVQGQMSNEQSWDIKKACVRVFDLQHKEDVECYENLLSESMVTDPVKVLLQIRRNDFLIKQTTGWCMLRM